MTDGGAIRVLIRDISDLTIGRRRVRELGVSQGLSHPLIEALAIAVTEIGRNIVDYASGGEMVIERVSETSRRGVAVTFVDGGPGIADVQLAMSDGYSTGRGLGLGLPGAQRLVHDFVIESKVGEGTRIVMRQWTRTKSRDF
jgi:serine/threonine-protein kinase RsbT